VYGAERHAYLDAMQGLFAAVPFHVVAPSRVALDLFLARTVLPFRSARVHENAVLAAGDAVAAPLAGPPRVAFAGFAIPPKGWPAFQRLLQRQGGHGGYRFMHFAVAANHVPMTGLEKVDVEVRPGDRFAMVRALRAAEVDLVAVLSPWPETFSFVAHEAFAAGADVVALAESGNVAAAVRRHRRGVVLRDEEAVLRFFEEGWALDYARQRAASAIDAPRLVPAGTTATLAPERLGTAPCAGLSTGDPGLVVLRADGSAVARLPGEGWRYSLPPGTAEVRLVSRLAIGGAGGVAVGAVRFDGAAIALDGHRFGEGWHAPEDGRRWTAGRAVLRVAGVRLLEIELVPGIAWRRVPLAG
jgi:hypothetical protein